MAVTPRCARQAATLMLATSLALPSMAWSARGGPAVPGQKAPRAGHADGAIRRALSLLQISVTPPIDVIDVDDLPQPLRRVTERSCAFVRKGVPRIQVNSSCAPYLAADESLIDAMKLAAILRHEMAHLEGADEAGARDVEARTFRELVRTAPYLLRQSFEYAVELDRRAAAAREPQARK